MFTYVGLIKLTPQGREQLTKAPEYLEKIRAIIEEEGGVLEDTFAIMGPWDFLEFVKYPDNETAFRVLAKIGLLEVVETRRSRGAARSQKVDGLPRQARLSGAGAAAEPRALRGAGSPPPARRRRPRATRGRAACT